jgi:hypothetical protein
MSDEYAAIKVSCNFQGDSKELAARGTRFGRVIKDRKTAAYTSYIMYYRYRGAVAIPIDEELDVFE